MGAGRGILVAILFASLSFGTKVLSADAETLYQNRDGMQSVVRVYGTSTLHDWTVEGRTVRGTLSLPRSMAFNPGAAVEAELALAIPAKTLRSVKDGKPYSKGMDKAMYEKLKADDHPVITYRLTRLTLRECREGLPATLLFDSEGEVTAAGASSRITMPLEVTPLPEGRVRVRGEVWMKMTDFKIEPPRNLLVLRTGDDVRVAFEWTAAADAEGR